MLCTWPISSDNCDRTDDSGSLKLGSVNDDGLNCFAFGFLLIYFI